MTIISQAPCRISLVGGGTDVNPFANTFGGQVLSLAVSLYYQAELTSRSDQTIVVAALNQSRRFPLKDFPLIYQQDPDFDLIRAILNHFRPDFTAGFTLKVSTQAKNVLGLGSSAAASVAMIQAISRSLKIDLSKAEIAALAFQLETKELGWPGGKQDQYASAFGGFNHLLFGPGDQVKVMPLKLSASILSQFKSQLLLFSLGGRRHSADQQAKLVQGMSDQEKHQALLRLKAAVDQALDLLGQADWSGLGRLLDNAWKDKKLTNPQVTNPQIDQIYQAAVDQGAAGGKIIGSGGAGSMFFLASPEKHPAIIQALALLGAEPVNFDLDWKGVNSQIL